MHHRPRAGDFVSQLLEHLFFLSFRVQRKSDKELAVLYLQCVLFDYFRRARLSDRTESFSSVRTISEGIHFARNRVWVLLTCWLIEKRVEGFVAKTASFQIRCDLWNDLTLDMNESR
jgi:hypothetical protein